MAEHFTKVFPDQLIQLDARHMPRPAPALGYNCVVSSADVVAAAIPGGAGVRTLLADSAADQGSEQVVVAVVVARGVPLVMREFLGHQLEDLQINYGRHRDRDPFFLGTSLAGNAGAHWRQRRLACSRWYQMGAVAVSFADIGGILEDAPYGASGPTTTLAGRS